jgi:hypothetical protein
LARLAVVMLRAGFTTIARFAVALNCGLDESFTVIAAVLVPAAVGVPLITPVVALIDSPAGNPVADQLYGVVPPLAVTGPVYALFTVPFGRTEVVMFRPGPVMAMARFAVALNCGLDESFTVMAAVLVPAAVGVPLITPVVAFIDSPVGNPVADQLYGVVPPAATTVAL